MARRPAGGEPGGGYLEIQPEVAEALAAGAPVVALESTIISHGMPYPDNVECARGVEAVVRAAGAVPATITLMDGAIRVGLDDAGAQRCVCQHLHMTASAFPGPALPSTLFRQRCHWHCVDTAPASFSLPCSFREAG